MKHNLDGVLKEIDKYNINFKNLIKYKLNIKDN